MWMGYSSHQSRPAFESPVPQNHAGKSRYVFTHVITLSTSNHFGGVFGWDDDEGNHTAVAVTASISGSFVVMEFLTGESQYKSALHGAASWSQ